MELNTKGRYAVMALADLAKYGVDSDGARKALPLSVVATRQGLSLAYLEQLFAKLRRDGLVESVRGRAGGYRLARDPDVIVIGDIMASVEEGIRMTRCAPGDAPCLGRERCLTHDLWVALGSTLSSFLFAVTLDDVVSGRLRGAAASGVGPQAEQPATSASQVPR
ncbi:MAG: Rrf2 family transcriptional regulator [Pseudomonadota bacterium]